jgi:hypothetical protein
METGFFSIVLLIVLGVSYTLIKLAIGIRLNSVAWITWIEKHDSSAMMFQQRFWKSCKPLEICAGRFFVFSSPNFFLLVYGKIILESVINLLLAQKTVDVGAKVLYQ